MADTYTFGVSHVGKEGTGDFGKRFGRIDERTTVTVQANSLEEAKNKVKNSPEVDRNKEQAIRRQNQDGTPRPRLVVRSIVQNPGQPDQKILKESVSQKRLRTLAENQVKEIRLYDNRKPVLELKNMSPRELFNRGIITSKEYRRFSGADQFKPLKDLGQPMTEGQNIKSQPGGARFTTPLGRFTGMKLPPKKLMNEGGIVKGEKGGFIRQRTKTVRIF